jgi:acyl-CoA-binding protein
LYKDSDLAERLAQNAWETVKSRGQEVEEKYLSLVDALVSRKKPG